MMKGSLCQRINSVKLSTLSSISIAWNKSNFPLKRSHYSGSHSHSHERASQDKANAEEKAHRSAVFVTWLGLGKNISLCTAKAVIGVQSNSAALVADAFHSLSDMVSDAVAMAALKVARRPPNPLHPYGHGKFEAIGALSVSSMLIAAGGGLIYHAAELCMSTEAVLVPTHYALWASLACAGINEVRPPRRTVNLLRCLHYPLPVLLLVSSPSVFLICEKDGFCVCP
jgi:hypothetical protein